MKKNEEKEEKENIQEDSQDSGEKAIQDIAGDAESLQKALEEEKNRALHYVSNWQRAQADLVNYKKRAEQEKEEAVKYGNSLLVLNLLSVLDDLERALGAIPDELADLTWVDGIKLIHRKLQTLLEQQGLSPINAVGQAFDPALHEAAMYQEGEENQVVAEVQKGYKFNDRVLRPAMVIVGKGEKEAGSQEPEDSST